jgi:hypothetical protein
MSWRKVAMRGYVQDRPFVYKKAKPVMTVKCVCSECNHGWMSDLENLSKPLIGGLVQDISLNLDESQQLALARWVMKTCMSLELIGRFERRKFYTDEECQNLRLELTLPIPSFVWLGRYGGINRIGGVRNGYLEPHTRKTWNDSWLCK